MNYLSIASYYRKLSADIKMENYKIQTSSFGSPEGPKSRWKLSVIRCYTWFFQYGWELVLIQRIFIGFEAILDKVILVNLPHTLLSLKSYFLYMSEYVRYALAKKRCFYKPNKKIRKILKIQILVYIKIKINTSFVLLGLGLTKLVLIL